MNDDSASYLGELAGLAGASSFAGQSDSSGDITVTDDSGDSSSITALEVLVGLVLISALVWYFAKGRKK